MDAMKDADYEEAFLRCDRRMFVWMVAGMVNFVVFSVLLGCMLAADWVPDWRWLGKAVFFWFILSGGVVAPALGMLWTAARDAQRRLVRKRAENLWG